MTTHSARGRALAGALALACCAVVLTACQTPPEPEAEGPGCAPEGIASLGVTAEGELFTRPEVSFSAPLAPLTTERTVLVEGDGADVVLGSIVTVEFVAFNGASGEALESTGYDTPGIGRTVLVLDSRSAMPGLRRALLCSTVGSRVAAVVHPQDGIGDVGSAIGIGADDPVVYVFDIVALANDRADGEEQPQDPALPTVEDSATGRPVVTVPASSPPVELVVSTVLAGSGPSVRDGADVVIRYRAVLWRNGLTFSENWSEQTLTRTAMSELLPGVAQALIGQTVGSRVMTVVPPDLGFGRDGDLQSSVTGTDTLVYVIDILATT